MEKVKLLILLTIFSCFFSITVYEGLIILLLFITAFLIIKNRYIFNGYFLLPISMFSFPQIISTALFNMKAIHKAFEHGLFGFIYLLVPFLKVDYKDFERINKVILFAGYISLGYIIYSYFQNSKLLFLRGTLFELAMFSCMFAAVSLSMYFYTKNRWYLFLFVLFSILVFASARRSYMIAYILVIFLMLYVFRNLISRSTLYFMLAFCFLITVSTVYILTNKDKRFQHFYEVVTGKRKLDWRTFNIITTTRGYKFKRGIEKLRKSWQEGKYITLLIGHGIEKYKPYLPPPYESIFLMSEFIEKGAIGLLGILLFFYRYFKIFFKFSIRKKEDILIVPSLIIPSINIGATIFNVFWNATLPLYILLLGMVEYFYYKKGERANGRSP